MRNVNVYFQDENHEKIKASESKLNNQPVEQKNNSKLILGIDCGVFGLGLIGLVVWLIFRRKNNGSGSRMIGRKLSK